MFADDLRDSILQEAIQGKLVPQDPNDEPAEELVKRIRAEKQRLIKEKKIKKEKNVSEIYRRDGSWYETIDGKDERCIDDEIPFEIPESWMWCRLGSLLQSISDGTHKTPKYVDSGVPFLSIKDISKGYVDFSNVRYISEEEHEELTKRTKPSINDILLCRIGTLGKAVIIQTNDEFSIFVSLGLLRPIFSSLNKYIVFCINSPLGSSWIDKVKIGGGTHTFKINLGDIPSLLLPLPPMGEQKRIIDKVDSALPLIDQLKTKESFVDKINNSILDDLIRSIIQCAIQGKLVPQDPNDEPAEELVKRIRAEKQRLIKEKKIKKEKNVSEIYRRDGSWYETIDGKDERCIDDEIPFEIPESWIFTRFDTTMVNRDSERIPLSLEERSKKVKKYDYYGASGIIDYVDDYIFDEKLLLIGEDGANLLLRSKPVAFIAQGKYWVNNHVHVLQPLCGVMHEFLSYYINSIDLSEYITGTAQPKLNQKNMSKIIIPIPPINEQKRIIEKIDSLFAMIGSFNKKV